MQLPNLISTNIKVQPDLVQIAKFNDCQYFRIYGISGSTPGANQWPVIDTHFMLDAIKTCRFAKIGTRYNDALQDNEYIS